MEEIAIIVSGDTKPETIKHVLNEIESGFRLKPTNLLRDVRSPLDSTIVDAFTLVGVVLSAGQLASTLYQMMRARKKQDHSEPFLLKIVISNKLTSLSGKNKDEIEALLKPHEHTNE